MASRPPMPGSMPPTGHRLRSKTRPQGGTSAGFEPLARDANVSRRLRSKTNPRAASPVVGLAPVASLAQAGPGTPDANEEKKGSRWRAETRFPWFAFHTEDAAFRFRVSVALEAKRRSGGKVAVDWDSLTETQDGFALQWKQPVLFRGGHTWWSRLLEKVGGSLGSFIALIKDDRIIDCTAFGGQMSGWSGRCQAVGIPLLPINLCKARSVDGHSCFHKVISLCTRGMGRGVKSNSLNSKQGALFVEESKPPTISWKVVPLNAHP